MRMSTSWLATRTCWRIRRPHPLTRTTKIVSSPESDWPERLIAHRAAAAVRHVTFRSFSGLRFSTRTADSHSDSACSKDRQVAIWPSASGTDASNARRPSGTRGCVQCIVVSGSAIEVFGRTCRWIRPSSPGGIHHPRRRANVRQVIFPPAKAACTSSGGAESTAIQRARTRVTAPARISDRTRYGENPASSASRR